MKNINRRTKFLFVFFIVSFVTSVMFTNCSGKGFEGTKKIITVGPGIGTDGDPLIQYAWHLNNTGQMVFATKKPATAGSDLNLLGTWADGIYGRGVKVLVSDDGLEDTHEDLTSNYLYTGVAKDYTKSAPYLAQYSRPLVAEDNHGTAVAGLIAAASGNGAGSSGVAPLAQFANTNFLSEAITYTNDIIADQASSAFDVVNMSWGTTQNNVPTPLNAFYTALLTGVTSGRSGKGTVYIKSAGNDYLVDCHGSTSDCIGNSNFDPDNTTPYTVIIGALDASGIPATYSSPGANLWISSFGGEYGYNSPAMVTTDRAGCSVGNAKTSTKSTVAFEKGGSENPTCSYSVVFNGTSAAAPTVTGAVALILEANPNLTWRDVKYILAKTTTVPSGGTSAIPHPLVTLPIGAVWEQGWTTNAAGFKFHNWYGFGRINIDAAVAMARTYAAGTMSATFNSTGWLNRTGLSLSIPDNSATGVEDSVYVSNNYKVDGVQIRLNITHDNISELGVELTSPSGTKSIVVNMRNSLTGIQDYVGEVFLTNAFYQERAQGNWKIKIIDGANTKTGTLTSWSIQVIGSN